jgi:hypothetical protein
MALEEQVLPVDSTSVDSLTERFRRAKHIKDLWTPKFEECYEYAFPQRESFYAQEQAQTKTDKIFDETAVVGLQEFASRLQSGLVPNYARWAELVSGSEIPEDQRSEVDLALEQVTSYIFEIIQNSNFSQEAHEFLGSCHWNWLHPDHRGRCAQSCYLYDDPVNPTLY